MPDTIISLQSVPRQGGFSCLGFQRLTAKVGRKENAVTSGRAYLRLCLEAADLGLAGWPMAAVSDQPQTNAEICASYGIGSDRRLVQVIRFGLPSAPRPPRARRPLGEVILSVK